MLLGTRQYISKTVLTFDVNLNVTLNLTFELRGSMAIKQIALKEFGHENMMCSIFVFR